METLVNGDDDSFVATAQLLATRLQSEMDERMKPGFFVALRIKMDDFSGAAVLKLDVQDKFGAAIDRSGGEPDLEVVKELLDLPGDLQKGAVFPDLRADSEVVLVDKLYQTSLYFLRALDAEQIEKPGPATGTVMRLVRAVNPARTPSVAKALEAETKATTPKAFFDRNKDLLEPDQRKDVLDRLAQQRRPVRRLDPTRHPLMGVYRVDGITIRGRLTDLNEKVKPTPLSGGKWKIEITVSEEPRLEPE